MLLRRDSFPGSNSDISQSSKMGNISKGMANTPKMPKKYTSFWWPWKYFLFSVCGNDKYCPEPCLYCTNVYTFWKKVKRHAKQEFFAGRDYRNGGRSGMFCQLFSFSKTRKNNIKVEATRIHVYNQTKTHENSQFYLQEA